MWKKVLLVAFAVISSANSVSASDCATREGLTLGVGVGVQSTSFNAVTKDFIGSENLIESSSDDLGEFVSGTISETVKNNVVEGSLVDYSSLKNFHSSSGVMTNMSVGYKGLFGCNQYSVGFNAIFGYEGSSAKSYLTEYGSEITFEAGKDPETGETDLEILAVKSSDTYSNINPNAITVRGGLVFGAIASLGKEMAWGNFSALVGFKIKQFTLSYITADPIEAKQPEEISDVVDGVETLVPGIANLGAWGDTSLNEFSYSKMKKWIPALTVGFSTDYYINDNMSVGVSAYLDMFASSSFNLKDIEVSSPVVKEDGNQLTDSGTITLKNMTAFGMMLNLTYYFGGMSK